jgi:two-component system CheB/CheR fusion protein
VAAKKKPNAAKSLTAKKRQQPAGAGTRAKKAKKGPTAAAYKRAKVARKTPAKQSGERAAKNGSRFPVVAIGASAGGLEAITQLLKHLPADTGMAFVFIQHLDPRHSSQLPEMLGRTTAMPVIEASSHRQLEPNRVYVLPPNAQLTIARGALLLADRSQTDRRPPRPIDLFFESLAEERGQLALGVVLSGTGSDGTLGLTAIKAAGGVTFVQDEQSAQFAGMPSSAILAGVADFILTPEEIAKKLAELPRHPYVSGKLSLPALPARPSSDAEALQQITALLKGKTGVDFEAYKRSTFGRRVERRMMLAGIDTLPAYAVYVLTNPGELDLLFQDVFIHVTSFFRDPEAYLTLQKKVLPLLTQKREPGLPVRIWVPGCSTGEEVFSVAIAWLEYADQLREHVPVQIFGTDISPAAVDRARSGRYPDSIVANVSPERLRRFFVNSQQGYQVAKPVRDLCVFAVHNLLSDPPFTQLDLLTCRNVLIYLEPSFQNRLVELFHYTLRPGGCLILGPSEDIGKNAELFKVVDKKRRVYAKKPVVGRQPYELIPARLPWARYDALQQRHTAALAAAPSEVWAAADRLQMDKYSPASVIVNEQLEILQIRGHVGMFLEPAHGLPTRSLAKMARPGLEAAIPNLVRRANKTNAAARQEGLRLQTAGRTQRAAVEVTPFAASRNSKERYFLVAFELLDEAKKLAKTGRRGKPETAARRARRLANLEQDLSDTQASLLAAGEALDANAAELVAALEELQSGNEELQSMNEELQTSKEELQSANEELTTLNEELENRNHELSQALGNLNNLVDSVRLPILIVAGNLRIRLYNPAAARVLNIVSTDVGRPLGEIKTRLNVAELEPLINHVMRTLQPHDEEVQDLEGRWYAMRIRPYQSLENQIDGAVITWTDVSALRDSLSTTATSHENLASIVATVREPLLVLDPAFKVQMANTGFYELFGVTPGETTGRPLFELGDGQWDLPELRRLLGEVLPLSNQFQGLEIDRNFPNIGRRTMLLNARRVPAAQPQDERILLAIEDVTAVRQLTEMEQLRLLSGRLETVREEERTRLSREIHDELGGMLTGLKMQLFQLRSGLSEAQAPQAELILAMSRQIDTEMDFVRRTAASLRPHLLDDMGLVAAMEWQLAEFQKQSDVAVSFRSNVEDLILPSESQTAAFRIFQEALTNVARHAQASAVEVTLEARADNLQLVLHDNGRGIPPEALVGKESLGLVGMRERAQQLGGFMDIRSTPGEGTTIGVRVPLGPAGRKG